MKKFIIAVILTLSLTSVSHGGTKEDWWAIGATIVGVGVALSKESRNQDVRDIGRSAEIVMGSVNDGIGMKKYILPSQFESNPQVYSQWVKVARSRNMLVPEMDAGSCIYRMNAGLIEFDEPFNGCPKYVAVHPQNFY